MPLPVPTLPLMVLLNDQLVPSAALPLPNRGLAFGDGFFETLIWVDNHLRFAADHWARMRQAAAALYLALPEALASTQALEATLRRLVASKRQQATADQKPQG